MRTAILWCAFASFAGSLPAQESLPSTSAAGWRVRPDDVGKDASRVMVRAMPPGWHITSGPTSLLFDPTRRASGVYRARADISLFHPDSDTAPFGVFVGGRKLEASDPSYLEFLIRNDGRYRIGRRREGCKMELRAWTPHASIVRFDGSAPSVRNVLTVEVGAHRVDFVINGADVASYPIGDLETDGLVGLRVSRNLDLHVSELEVEPETGGP